MGQTLAPWTWDTKRHNKQIPERRPTSVDEGMTSINIMNPKAAPTAIPGIYLISIINSDLLYLGVPNTSQPYISPRREVSNVFLAEQQANI